MSKDKSNPPLDKELEELFEACEKGELETVQNLVRQNPKLINAQNERGITGLHAAAAYKQTEIAEFLIDNKADIGKTDKEGQTPLHWAASSRDNSKMLDLLLNKGAKIGSRDQDGGTALHLAAESGHTENIRLLLDKGANIEAKNQEGHTPLVLATESRSTEAVGLLLDKGAKADLEILHPLLEGTAGDKEVAKVLISKRRFDLNKINYKSINYRETPLEGAIKTEDHEMVKALLEGGADPNHIGDNGQRALHLAAESGHTESIRLLLDKGADPQAKDKRGKTPAEVAADKGHMEIGQLLESLTLQKQQTQSPKQEKQSPQEELSREIGGGGGPGLVRKKDQSGDTLDHSFSDSSAARQGMVSIDGAFGADFWKDRGQQQAVQVGLPGAFSEMQDQAKGLNEKIELLDTALKTSTSEVERTKYIKDITNNAQGLASRAEFYMSLANQVPYDQQPLVKLEGYMTVLNELGSDLVTNFLDPKQKEELQKSLARNKEACDKILENDPAGREKLNKAYDRTIQAITATPKTNLREKFGISENEFGQIQGALSKSIDSINQSISQNIVDARIVKTDREAVEQGLVAEKSTGRLVGGLAGRAGKKVVKDTKKVLASGVRRVMARGRGKIAEDGNEPNPAEGILGNVRDLNTLPDRHGHVDQIAKDQARQNQMQVNPPSTEIVDEPNINNKPPIITSSQTLDQAAVTRENVVDKDVLIQDQDKARKEFIDSLEPESAKELHKAIGALSSLLSTDKTKKSPEIGIAQDNINMLVDGLKPEQISDYNKALSGPQMESINKMLGALEEKYPDLRLPALQTIQRETPPAPQPSIEESQAQVSK